MILQPFFQNWVKTKDIGAAGPGGGSKQAPGKQVPEQVLEQVPELVPELGAGLRAGGSRAGSLRRFGSCWSSFRRPAQVLEHFAADVLLC